MTMVALATAGAAIALSASAERQRTVHVTVVDKGGAPVAGLSPADFEVKEDGKARIVLDAAPSSTPLSVAVLLDDRGGDINEIRSALAVFFTHLEHRAEVSLITVVPTPITLFDYTADGATMLEGVRRLVWRAGPASGLVLGAIADAADGLRRRESARSAIVVVTFEGDEFKSHRRADAVLASLERSRAALHVVAVGRPRLRRMNRALVESGDAQGDEWAVDENNRHAVLSEGPRLSGGHRQEIAAATGLSRALQNVVSDLVNQYTLVYQSVHDGRPPRNLTVSVKRRGVTVRSPKKIAG